MPRRPQRVVQVRSGGPWNAIGWGCLGVMVAVAALGGLLLLLLIGLAAQ